MCGCYQNGSLIAEAGLPAQSQGQVPGQLSNVSWQPGPMTASGLAYSTHFHPSAVHGKDADAASRDRCATHCPPHLLILTCATNSHSAVKSGPETLVLVSGLAGRPNWTRLTEGSQSTDGGMVDLQRHGSTTIPHRKPREQLPQPGVTA